MFGINFIKAAPTTHLIQYKDGAAKRSGAGLAFFYYGPTSTIVRVPVNSFETPFAFTEQTADFQTVTVQGQFTYRVANPEALASVLDFSVDDGGRYVTDDPEKVTERLLQTAHVLTRSVCQKMSLQETLAISDKTSREILEGFKNSPAVLVLGIEVLDFIITAVKATPEMARALEAQSRELLQRRSDEAIYERRNAAVNHERTIKENELNTELAVEEKKKQIRENKMAADIAVEERRTALIELKVENDKKEADAKAYGLEAVLKPVKEVDWRTLMAMNGGGEPAVLIASAFGEMAQNAQKIGQLNVTPDLLSTLLKRPN